MTKNENYRKFLDQGVIETIDEKRLSQALENASKSRLTGSKQILIVLYYTGCRPAEALEMTARMIERQGHYIIAHIPGGVKGSLPRSIYIKDKPLPRELYNYASSLHPEMYLFHAFRSIYERKALTKRKGIVTRKETTSKLRNHIYRWFKGVINHSINQYYLRHNFFSKMSAAGVPIEVLRVLKGARNISSVNCYSHLSTKTAKDCARFIK